MSLVIPANISWQKRQETTSDDDLDFFTPRWFAVRVGPRKEKVVARLLERDGIEHYLPLRERPFNYKSKAGVRQLPLLPSYIFVRIVAKQAVAVQRTTFVYGFVKIGKMYRRVAEAEIELLRRLSTDDSLAWTVEEKEETLLEGTPVEICRGPLAGVRGHYLRKKNKKTFVISFGGIDARLSSCEISPADIIPLNAPRKESVTQNSTPQKKYW